MTVGITRTAARALGMEAPGIGPEIAREEIVDERWQAAIAELDELLAGRGRMPEEPLVVEQPGW